jgi:hypothetical protein
MAVVFAILAFSLIAASAAWLGPVTTSDVGSDVAVVGSCDTDGVHIDWDTPGYSVTAANSVVQGAQVSGIDPACADAELTITFTNAAGDAVLDTSNTVSIANPVVNPVAVGGFEVETAQLVRVVVVING